jgi:hypothetical protein
MSIFSAIFCFLSTFFIIQVMIQLAPTDYGLKHTRITVQVVLVAAIILSLSAAQAAQCIDIKEVRQGIGPYAASD